MWQRFTERARKVVFFAQEEAQKFGEGYVSTEHLLLGLLRDSDSVALRVLENTGIDPKLLRTEVETALSRGDGVRNHEMTLTPRAKRVIDLAYDEARLLGNDYIGTEHLLLGLIREGEGLAGRILAKLDVYLDACRIAVKGMQNADGPKTSSNAEAPRQSESAAHYSRLLVEAIDRSITFVAHYESTDDDVRPIHLLIGLFVDPSEPLQQLLKAQNADPEDLLAELRTHLNYAESPPGKQPAFHPSLETVFKEALQLKTPADTLAALQAIYTTLPELKEILEKHLNLDQTGLNEFIQRFRSNNPG